MIPYFVRQDGNRECVVPDDSSASSVPILTLSFPTIIAARRFRIYANCR